MNKQQTIQDFELIRDTAELKALSNLSMERPLNDAQFNRMMELGTKLGYK